MNRGFPAVLCVATACSVSTRGDADGLSGGADTTGAPSSTEGAGAEADADSSEGGAADGGLKLDVANVDDGGSSGPGCKKVDFLFVVDNSGSMWNNQVNLASSFPGFISTIQDTLAAHDYHILVTDSDAWTPQSTIGGSDTGCEIYPECCFEFCGPGSTCHGAFSGDTSYGACPTPPPPPSVCDATLGAGRRLDADMFDLDDCGIADGRRYMLETQPDLLGTFECVAKAGIGGDWNERPVLAAVAAVSPELVGPGGCNEGFLREDALLVVTIIADANPYSGHLDTDVPNEQPYEALLAAKGGDPEALVVLGLFDDGGLPGAVCDGNGNHKYFDFVALFGDRGIPGSVCAPDYTPFFLDAVDDIDVACDEFEPEG